MAHVLIVGGGIAGPVAAMALQRAGLTPVVYEAQSVDAANAGAWLTLAVNGLDALRGIDLHRQVMAAGFASRTIAFCSASGRLLAEVPIGGRLDDGTVTHTLRRTDLHHLLHDEAVRRGIRFEYGKRMTGFATASRSCRITAQFDDGSRAVGDLLIGADGIHSRTRHVLDVHAPRPRYTGLVNVGGFAGPEAIDAAPGDYRMIFGKRAFFGFTVSPAREIFWFANLPTRHELDRATLAALTTNTGKQRLAELFAADSTPVAAIIRSTRSAIVATNQHDLPSVRTWHRGRAVIIGDAAHAASPSSGQGASMAIEDAAVLGRCLRDAGEPQHALARYERLRRSRVERVVAYGARWNSAKVAGLLGRVVRDAVLPLALRLQARQQREGAMAWLFDYHIDWGAAPADPTPELETR